MPYFHVLVSTKDAPTSYRPALVDLSEAELKRRFVRPYKAGRDIKCADEILQTKGLHDVKVRRTDRVAATEIDDIEKTDVEANDRFNRQSSGFMWGGVFGQPESLLRAGEDVTGKYITEAPGTEGVLARTLSSPWTRGIGIAIAGAAVGWLLK